MPPCLTSKRPLSAYGSQRAICRVLLTEPQTSVSHTCGAKHRRVQLALESPFRPAVPCRIFTIGGSLCRSTPAYLLFLNSLAHFTPLRTVCQGYFYIFQKYFLAFPKNSAADEMFCQYFKSQRNKYGAAHGSCNAARFAASFVADSCADKRKKKRGDKDNADRRKYFYLKKCKRNADSKRIYARQYGYKAFRIAVKN